MKSPHTMKVCKTKNKYSSIGTLPPKGIISLMCLSAPKLFAPVEIMYADQGAVKRVETTESSVTTLRTLVGGNVQTNTGKVNM